VARGIPGLPKHLLPFPVEYTFTISPLSQQIASNHLNTILSPLELTWQYHPSSGAGIGFAKENVWSRSARRQKARSGHSAANYNNSDEDEGEEKPRLGFKIEMKPTQDAKGIQVLIRWILGTDTVMFESFCGMLKSQMTAA
jgi:23S rRNA (adenine1618-N6)-methyltransferase